MRIISMWGNEIVWTNIPRRTEPCSCDWMSPPGQTKAILCSDTQTQQGDEARVFTNLAGHIMIQMYHPYFPLQNVIHRRHLRAVRGEQWMSRRPPACSTSMLITSTSRNSSLLKQLLLRWPIRFWLFKISLFCLSWYYLLHVYVAITVKCMCPRSKPRVKRSINWVIRPRILNSGKEMKLNESDISVWLSYQIYPGNLSGFLYYLATKWQFWQFWNGWNVVVWFQWWSRSSN